ncbi:MAG TPA: cyclic pyranopterin monophosphate synthase MoaC [Halobacteriales archaeon]|uniref:cyclic pyranopterin monophosphate synthase MoaC n=1 Tax=Candidatus Hikarchaeum yamanae TaxID=2675326 RepID=UPI0017E61896|nr:cyclic pyranopterin monophosphate synthase MoaC [Halobacteriales archaeon]|tara:strand:+ start:14786 stop:15259 length:474 start_codon:yes stop_codon:yes gene_type:complete
MNEKLTHIDHKGDANMVNIGNKKDVMRKAKARGEIRLKASTIAAIEKDSVAKGNVLSVARVGAIDAVKHTWEIIPLCHQIDINGIEVKFSVEKEKVIMEVEVETFGKTGCEMEALVGLSIGLNTIWDMVKSIEKDENGKYPTTSIGQIEVIEKVKGD